MVFLERSTRGHQTQGLINEKYAQKWKSFLEFVKKRKKTEIGLLLEHGTPNEWIDNSLSIEFKEKSFHLDRIQTPKLREELNALLSEFSGKPTKAEIVSKS